MKRIFLLIGMVLVGLNNSFPQVQIVQENFGSSTWDGNPADYPGYTSDALFSGDDSHLFQTANSTGYDEASGGVALLMGSWSDPPENLEFVIQYNTEDYTSVRLSFGMIHNSGGWGDDKCNLTNNYTSIEYSTDGSIWTTIDKSALLEGSSWPCSNEAWKWVKLAEVLPSHPTLYIRFTHDNPSIHPYYLDDITLTGFLPDNTPPTAAGNLAAEKVGTTGFILLWNAATDENGISRYDVLKNGNYLLSTTDTVVLIDYQNPGSSADYSVIAYDIADNASPESAVLPVSLNSRPVDYQYSWERPHATVLPGGDLEWNPQGFQFEAGSSVRYIDFESGDDTNDGLDKATAWKHHPWDNNASDNAAACTGVHTYIFKRGVVYRGHLTAKESGTLLEPIRLTSDPSWGTGEAYFFGSQRITGGWTLGDASSAPNIPEPDKVWYIDISLPETKMICELNGNELSQLRVARTPNYQYTPDDPLKTWWTWTGKTEDGGALWLTDDNNLTQDDPAYYQGATVWSQEDAIVMCTVWNLDVTEWDPDNNRVRVNNTNFGGTGCHYFIENTPFLLDAPGEFYYDMDADRLFVRLEGDKDPNTAILEVATRTELINISDKHDIEISGITFGVTTAHAVRYGEEDARSTIRMTGICNNINIRNNKFLFVNGGISMRNTGSAMLNSHSITISDNDFQHVGDLALVLATGTVYMDDVHILRNNIYNNGYRHQGRWYSSIPAIYAQLNYGEVAGNIVDVSWGNGIDMFWGKGGGSNLYVPFIRGLIHHNKASNTLIGVNDYGGIESWQGGPAFCYNNYSHNASGYKHYNNSSLGMAFYFDGSFKHTVFNNIASGVSHNRNATGIMQVLGFYNMYVHNTCYNTQHFFNSGSNNLALNGHNAYLANIGQDITNFFRHEIPAAYIPFESYGYNIASGEPFRGSLENKSNSMSLSGFMEELEGFESQLTQTGWESTAAVLVNPASFNFTPAKNSAAIGRGVKFFSVFPLSRVVGEWNFYRHPADSSIVMGDNFYMTEDFNDRITYKNVPKNHLHVHNVIDSSFVMGDLEDWTEGALIFDGAVYGQIEHSVAVAVKSNNVNMTTNDFIIEVYLRTEKDYSNGVIVSKYDGSEGYEMSVDDTGFPQMSLYLSGAPAVSLKGSAAVNDSAWHHILFEMDRHAGINCYIDGQLSNGILSGSMPGPTGSLSNTADFLVGKDVDDNYFLGTMDFLRVSKGSLYDAKTTVDELYAWQTDGPFLYDMRGDTATGEREAGALESFSTCDISVSENNLQFGMNAATQKVIVTAPEGYSVRDVSGEFFAYHVDADTIEVTVSGNDNYEENQGAITIVGCNQLLSINITQEGSPCIFNCEVDSLELDNGDHSMWVAVTTNGLMSASSDIDFVSLVVNNEKDSILLYVSENESFSERIAELTIEGCSGTHTITIIQQGVIDNINPHVPGGLKVYPNPVRDKRFYIELPPYAGRVHYTLSDLSGKALQMGELHDTRENIRLYVGPGTYILKVYGDGLSYIGRIVVL